MTFAVRAELRPWLGSAGLHALFALVLAMAAVSWRSDPPAPQLAIEGNVVRYEDLPSSVRTGKPLREPVTVTPPVESRPRAEPEPVPQPRPEPPPESRPEVSAQEQQAAAKAAATAERRQAERALEAKAQADEKARSEAALAAEKRAEAAAKSKLETARKLAAAEAAAQQKQQEDAAAEAVRAAKAAAAREAELRRALADEEAGEAVARSGVMDEYRALLVQTIERNWIRPPSARAGLECTLYVTQAAGGTVIDVKIGACNGDEAVRDSVANAVYRSSPLPAPRDARAFERRLVIVFKPRE